MLIEIFVLWIRGCRSMTSCNLIFCEKSPNQSCIAVNVDGGHSLEDKDIKTALMAKIIPAEEKIAVCYFMQQ